MWSRSSDEALLTGLGAGDPAASAAFVRRFQSRVYGLALTIVRDRPLADEVAQEAFVRAWRYAASYDARRGPVATWLLTIARNRALEALRGRGSARRAEEALTAEMEVTAEPDWEAEESLAAVGERERVRQALRELPPEQRRPVVLALFLGLTAREISGMDEIPLGTVKTRIRSALRRLRADLEVRDEL